MSPTRPAIAVSSCLLGENVRYDGGNKLDPFITEVLAEHFEFRPICPEVAIGLGTPRSPVHLRERDGNVRVVGSEEPTRDVTAALRDYGRRKSGELSDISGYIFKSKSPSCGLWRVPVHRDGGRPAGNGRGAYAEAFLEARPLLPAEEEGRLHDAVLRENFVARVYAFHRWQTLMREGITPERLVRFHAAHKLVLMSHDREAMGQLGRMVAEAGERDIEELARHYIAGFMRALDKRATRRRHADVLMHLMGYLKKALDTDDKQELLDLIHAYRRGEVPLVVPLTLFKHHFRRHPHEYVAGQVYLDPHPHELMVRNHV